MIRQMARVGRELGTCRRLTLEYEDLTIGEQQPQMVVGSPVAQPELEHWSLEVPDQSSRRLKTGTLCLQAPDEPLKPTHLPAKPIYGCNAYPISLIGTGI